MVTVRRCTNILRACSLHKASLSTQRRQADRPRHHPFHIHHPNPRFVAQRYHHVKSIPLREKTKELCYCHGSESANTFSARMTDMTKVFGNSNSLPISLVISLSKTISGLHWDQVPGDNDNEVAARGILYLLIFQQLGQLLRWSWGYNVLLKPPTDEEEQEGGENNEHDRIEEGRYRDDVEANENPKIKSSSSDYASGSDTHTPEAHSPLLSSSSSAHDRAMNGQVMATPTNGNIVGDGPGNMAGHMGPRNPSTGHITQFPSLNSPTSHDPDSLQGKAEHVQHAIIRWFHHTSTTISTFFSNLYRRFPVSLQKVLNTTFSYLGRFVNAIYQSMNPPLWAMLIAVVVASVPALQRLFFEKGTFINNSVTSAVAQSGGVAVPLILVVLGANLARNTIPQEDKASTPEEKKEERNLLYASLISRMLLPTIIMAPLLALCAKYIPVSILDDPIFVIVCFLLTGAPSALQLAQICQLHNVFMGVMSRLLFQSYVIWYVSPRFGQGSKRMIANICCLAGSYRAHLFWSCLLWKWWNGLRYEGTRRKPIGIHRMMLPRTFQFVVCF